MIPPQSLSLLDMTPDQVNNEIDLASAVLASADNGTLANIILDMVLANLVGMTDFDTPATVMMAATYRVAAAMVIEQQAMQEEKQ